MMQVKHNHKHHLLYAESNKLAIKVKSKGNKAKINTPWHSLTKKLERDYEPWRKIKHIKSKIKLPSRSWWISGIHAVVNLR